MVEDISAQIRLSVEITAMSTLLMTVVALMVIGLDFITYYEGTLINAYQNVSHVTINAISAERAVSSANVYKIVSTLGNEVKSVTVQNLDGSNKTLLLEAEEVNNSFEYLMRHPAKKYTVEVVRVNGMYAFKLQEVD